MKVIREIKWFIQRGKRGYADCDVWDFDSYLSRVIAGGVRQLKGGLSYPPKLTIKKWEKALERIAVGFEAHDRLVNDIEVWDDEVLKTKLKQQWGIGIYEFKKWFGNLWD